MSSTSRASASDPILRNFVGGAKGCSAPTAAICATGRPVGEWLEEFGDPVDAVDAEDADAEEDAEVVIFSQELEMKPSTAYCADSVPSKRQYH